MKKALFVDENPENTAETDKLLAIFGLSAVYTTNGIDAVTAYEADPSYDVVFVSLEMKGMNGFTIASMIRKYQMAKRPIIIGVVDTDLSRLPVTANSQIDYFVTRTAPLTKIMPAGGKLSLVLGGRHAPDVNDEGRPAAQN